MNALGRLWTWIGYVFITYLLYAIIFVRNGSWTQSSPPLGVRVSQAYLGLLLTLLAGIALTVTAALYARAAKQKGIDRLLPPNTTLEETGSRNALISAGTAVVFVVAFVFSFVAFSASYSESEIHRWDDRTPVQTGFYASRVKALSDGCVHQPCFALGQRMGENNAPYVGVFEYILYMTDGALIFLALSLVGSGLFLLINVFFTKKKAFI